MPFDVNKSTGKWKHGENSDNYKQIMEKLGVPSEMWDQLKDAEFPVNSSLSGNVMTSKVEAMGKTIENTFTLGVEGEETDPMGTKRKVTYTMEGEDLVSVYPSHDGKGLTVTTRRHFVDDNTIRVAFKVGDLEGWATSKRC
ncbi:PREDICTED: fatty acid-binding protein 1, liver-like [Branchiostoma belcheri]|uniref:Fatty acid-binding protein 1, liver-like n=1 Tax=Branchiostoma belcheri TaxID=7741 RepID=A0A6P4YSL4_BRABE|nr:PREDICTED: fatty acid-binding protein 1, liver-like [Branchiostoma belcheri]